MAVAPAPSERRRPRFAYMPFGGGPHQCIGSAFSMMEATLILATLAQHFAPVLVDGKMPAPEYRVLARPQGEVRMRLESSASAQVPERPES